MFYIYINRTNNLVVDRDKEHMEKQSETVFYLNPIINISKKDRNRNWILFISSLLFSIVIHIANLTILMMAVEILEIHVLFNKLHIVLISIGMVILDVIRSGRLNFSFGARDNNNGKRYVYIIWIVQITIYSILLWFGIRQLSLNSALKNSFFLLDFLILLIWIARVIFINLLAYNFSNILMLKHSYKNQNIKHANRQDKNNNYQESMQRKKDNSALIQKKVPAYCRTIRCRSLRS